ncbi:MAG: HEPN domain-containing protein, partial [Planctomycetota bacterium]
MKTDLSHLPQDKQDELRHVTALIREAADPEMIVLFGSHARGDWVEDRHEEGGVLYQYVSDYDILLVVKSREHGASCRLWQQVERTVREKLPAGSHVNAIAHNIDHVNQKLAEGHYFFTDIVKEGVLLYDSGRYELAEAKELDADERRRVAQEHFDQWFPSATVFLKQFQYAFSDGNLKEAAFLLHQAAERFYTTILLVFMGHKPKTHDLERLRRLATAQ